MKSQELQIPKAIFEAISPLVSVDTIAYEGKVRGTKFIHAQEFVFTGAVGTGTGHGWAEIDGYVVQDVQNYKGELKPMPYQEHWNDVDNGNRARCYTGMSVKNGNRTLVMLDKFTFTPNSVEQLYLFKI
jgi:hypothetical protein